MNLRAKAESHLAKTLENPNHFGGAVILTSPDGVKYDPVYGQILYDTRKLDSELGAEVLVHDPVVTVRLASLARVPAASEKYRWAVTIPDSPRTDASWETYLLARPSEDGCSLGLIRFYLSKTRQSP